MQQKLEVSLPEYLDDIVKKASFDILSYPPFEGNKFDANLVKWMDEFIEKWGKPNPNHQKMLQAFKTFPSLLALCLVEQGKYIKCNGVRFYHYDQYYYENEILSERNHDLFIAFMIAVDKGFTLSKYYEALGKRKLEPTGFRTYNFHGKEIAISTY